MSLSILMVGPLISKDY